MTMTNIYSDINNALYNTDTLYIKLIKKQRLQCQGDHIEANRTVASI